jgi:glycosyltransferase involved in cell wall biosynthesis
MDFILFATAWGRRFGGINAFNQDFAVGLAEVLGNRGAVYCVVPDALAVDTASAEEKRVHLVPLGKSPNIDRFDEDWIRSVARWFQAHQLNVPNACWVGHDVISGEIAVAAADEFRGVAALIHHMSYGSYQSVKYLNSVAADQKFRQQEQLFSHPNVHLFAVGPALRDSCELLSGRKDVTCLVPGFPEPDISTSSQEKFLSAIIFGRLDRVDDRIKQGSLAAAAFGNAIKVVHKERDPPEVLRNPELHLIGLGQDRDQEQNIFDLVQLQADAAVNLKALPFDEDRSTLFGRIRRANLALMLSWHEGFGLTGWEAIAAEVPLIVGRNSGLYQLIRDELGRPGEACLSAMRIRGPIRTDEQFHPSDLEEASNEIISVSKNLAEHRRAAVKLKEDLKAALGCTWRDTAETFLRAIHFGETHSGGPPPALSRPRSPSPTTTVPSGGAPLSDAAVSPSADAERIKSGRTAARKSGSGGAEKSDLPNIPPPLGSRMHFIISNTGEITFAPPSELDAQGNHIERLRSLHPLLSELAKRLVEELSYGNRPHSDFLERAKEYLELVDQPLNGINFALFYVRGVRLANFAATTQVKIKNRELPELPLRATEVLGQLLPLHGAFILSTSAGQEAIAYEGQYSRSALKDRASRAAMMEFADILKGRPGVIEESVAMEISAVAAEMTRGSNLARNSIIAEGAIRNLCITLIASASAATLSLSREEFVHPLKDMLQLLAAKLKATSGGYVAIAEYLQREAVRDQDVKKESEALGVLTRHRDFVLENVKFVRALRGLSDSWSWIGSALIWISKEKSNRGSKK